MLHNFYTTQEHIPGCAIIMAISFTTLFLIVSLQQLCITRIIHKQKLWSRLLTLIWCIYAFLLNGLQIYSFHNNSHTVMIYLRASMIFGIVVGIIATYRLVIDIVNSVYLYQTKYAIKQAPKWFTDIWRIILSLDIISLFIFYGTAFKTGNAIFFDVHFICLGITFWIGAFSVLVAILRINKFLRKTIVLAAQNVHNANNTSLFGANLSSISNYDNNLIQVEQSTEQNGLNRTLSNESMQSTEYQTIQKIRKFNKLRLRLILICFIGSFLVIPMTVYSIRMFIHVIHKKYHHNITEQPFPNYWYIGYALFLNAMDVQLLTWTFTFRNGCIDAEDNLFCKLFCCNLCFNLTKPETPKYRERSPGLSSNDKSRQYTAVIVTSRVNKNKAKMTDGLGVSVITQLQ